MFIKNFFYKVKRKLFNLIFKISFLEKPLPKDPFGKKLYGDKETYLYLHQEAIESENIEVSRFEKDYGYSIDKKWFSNLALHTQACIKKSKLNYSHGKLLYTLLSNYLNNLKISNKHKSQIIIFETGTSRGFSAICMSKALIDNKVKGNVITIDCISHNEEIIWNCIDDFNGPRTRSKLLEEWKDELSNIIFIQGWTMKTIHKIGIQRINFAFLDAQHTKKDVLNEFNYVAQRQLKGDIIFFDDVTQGLFEGVCEAVNEIESKYPYKIKRLNFSNTRSYAFAVRI